MGGDESPCCQKSESMCVLTFPYEGQPLMHCIIELDFIRTLLLHSGYCFAIEMNLGEGNEKKEASRKNYKIELYQLEDLTCCIWATLQGPKSDHLFKQVPSPIIDFITVFSASFGVDIRYILFSIREEKEHSEKLTSN